MQGTIEIRNIRTGRVVAGKVNIMRPNILGNPFRITASCSREEAIRQYQSRLRDEWRRGGAVRALLVELAERFNAGEHIVLVCCCVPLACHGSVVAAAIRGVAR